MFQGLGSVFLSGLCQVCVGFVSGFGSFPLSMNLPVHARQLGDGGYMLVGGHVSVNGGDAGDFGGVVGGCGYAYPRAVDSGCRWAGVCSGGALVGEGGGTLPSAGGLALAVKSAGAENYVFIL